MRKLVCAVLVLAMVLGGSVSSAESKNSLSKLSNDFISILFLMDYDLKADDVKEYTPDADDGVSAKELVLGEATSYLTFYDENGEMIGIEISTNMHKDVDLGIEEISEFYPIMILTIVGVDSLKEDENKGHDVLMDLITNLKNEDGTFEGEYEKIVNGFLVTMAFEVQEIEILGTEFTFQYMTLNIKDADK